MPYKILHVQPKMVEAVEPLYFIYKLLICCQKIYFVDQLMAGLRNEKSR